MWMMHVDAQYVRKQILENLRAGKACSEIALSVSYVENLTLMRWHVVGGLTSEA